MIVNDHLNGEIFSSLAEARVVIEAWRVHYNTARPHSSLGYRPPAPEAVHWPPPRAGISPAPGIRIGTETHHALRLKPDHTMGAGHNVPKVKQNIFFADLSTQAFRVPEYDRIILMLMAKK